MSNIRGEVYSTQYNMIGFKVNSSGSRLRMIRCGRSSAGFPNKSDVKGNIQSVEQLS